MQDSPSIADPLRDANVRAASYFVLQAQHDCTRCAQRTTVFALALPAGHESTEADIELDDEDSPGLAPGDFQDWLFSAPTWQKIDSPALLSQVGLLPAAVAQTLQTLAPALRLNPEQGGQWANFCEHCGSAVWEGALYATPGQPFCPKDDAAAAQITVYSVDNPVDTPVDAPFHAYARMVWTDGYRNKWPLLRRLGWQDADAP